MARDKQVHAQPPAPPPAQRHPDPPRARDAPRHSALNRFSCRHVCPHNDVALQMPTHRVHESGSWVFVTVDQSASIVAALLALVLCGLGTRRMRALVAARRSATPLPRASDAQLESQECMQLQPQGAPVSDALEHVDAAEATKAEAATNQSEQQAFVPLHAIDHAKFFLNTAILLNHGFNHLHHAHHAAPWSLAYYCWCETFVMPTFALISGFLTKGELTPAKAQRTVATVWAPFAVIHVLADATERLRAAARRAHEHGSTLGEFGLSCRWPFPNMVGSVPSVAWYLQCWISWKLLLPTLRAFEGGGGTGGKARLLAVAFAISWLGGYWSAPAENSFHMDTTISMLAPFVLGHVLPHSLLKRVGARLRLAAAATHVLISCGIVALAYATYVPCTEPAVGKPLTAPALVVWAVNTSRRSYFAPHSGALERMCGVEHNSCGREYYLWWTQRALQQLLALVLGGSFIIAMPNRETRWSRHGRHSLYAYLLQTILYLPFIPTIDMAISAGLDAAGFTVPGCQSALNMPKMVVYSLCATYVLTSEACRSICCVIFEPTWLNWLWGKPYRSLPHGRSLLFFLAASTAKYFVSQK